MMQEGLPFLHPFAQATTSLVVLLGSMMEEGSMELVGTQAVGSTLVVGKQVCMVEGSTLVVVGSKQAVGSILVLDSIQVYMVVGSKDRDRSSSLLT